MSSGDDVSREQYSRLQAHSDEQQVHSDDLQARLDDLQARFDSIAHTPRINEPMWFGWTRWRWMLISYVMVCVVMFVAVWLAVENANELDDSQTDQAVYVCESQRRARDGIRELIVRIVSPNVELTPEQQERQQEIFDILDEELPPITCDQSGNPLPDR